MTGFAKRKAQRRKEALAQIEKKKRQERIEDRAERRRKMRESLGITEEDLKDSSDEERAASPQRDEDEEEGANRQVQRYKLGNNLTATVTIQPLGHER